MARTYTESEYKQAYDRGWTAGYQYGYSQMQSHKDDVEIAAQLAQQRDYHRGQYDNLSAQIDLLWEGAQQDYILWEQEDQALAQFLKNASESGRLPHLTQALLHIHDIFEEYAVEHFNSLSNVSDEHMTPGRKLVLTKLLVRIIEARRVATQVATAALGYSEYSPAICDQICRQLRNTGQVEVKWLTKLQNWIASNQSDTPQRLDKIKEALELSQAQRKSGKNVTVFAELQGLDRKTVQRANEMYDFIEREAHKVSPELKQVLSTGEE